MTDLIAMQTADTFVVSYQYQNRFTRRLAWAFESCETLAEALDFCAEESGESITAFKSGVSLGTLSNLDAMLRERARDDRADAAHRRLMAPVVL
jgi:hypothetical protein